MKFRFQIFLLLICSFILIVQSSVLNYDSETEWTNKLSLEKENIKFQWKNTDSDEDGQRWIIMEVSAKAKGYVGVGFSPHGGMANADMGIAWMGSDGVANLRDFYGIENGTPIEDERQDYQLLHYTTNGDWTTVQFKRKWDTCDPQDFVISNDTMRLIWAYSDLKPEIRNGQFIGRMYHGPRNRGAKSVIIAEGGITAAFPDEAPEQYPGVKTFDMVMDKVPITLKDTYYYCKMFKFSDLSKKHHQIGWKPIIETGNEDIVHHMLVFECNVPEEEILLFDRFYESHRGDTCYTPNMPPEWGKNCVSTSFVWVVGSEGEMFPEHVGNPLGQPHGGATYFMIEMHYENAAHRTTTDSSGVRVFYTDQLRENDGGTLLIGYRHSPFLLIPPHQDNIVIHGLCGDECTSKAIPPTGIHITNANVHLHLTGKRIRLRHFRDGVEQPMIAEDNYYDFNYQQGRSIKDERTVLPGDHLLAECEYSTTGVNRYVVGGLATNQEMCQVFVSYYPRMPLAQCTSQYEFHDFFKALGINEVEGKVLNALHMPYDPSSQTPDKIDEDIGDDAKELEAIEAGISFGSVFNHMNITKPSDLKGENVGKYLENYEWSNEKGKVLEDVWKHGKHYQFCSKPGMKRIILHNHIMTYPNIIQELPKGPSEVCKKEHYYLLSGSSTLSSSLSATSFCFVVSIILLIRTK